MARDYTDKIAKQAVDLLPDGETVRRAVIANPTGGFMDSVNSGSAAVVWAALRAKEISDEVREGGGVAATVPRCNAYLTVTNERLVIFDLTKMGKLKSVIAAFSPAEIDTLQADQRNRNTADLLIGFPDGSACVYAVIQKQDAAGFVAEFESLG